MSIEEQRARLEHALDTGQVRIIGKEGRLSASPEFLTRLGELPPSARRLALARACVLPWGDRIHELPECYRRELTRALGEWREDSDRYPDAKLKLAGIFDDVPEPISVILLRQLVETTPTDRHWCLIFALAAAWSGGFRSVLHASPDAPRWLARELAYHAWTSRDEFRMWKLRGWV